MTREQALDMYIAVWWFGFVGFVWIGARWSGGPKFQRTRRHGPRVRVRVRR